MTAFQLTFYYYCKKMNARKFLNMTCGDMYEQFNCCFGDGRIMIDKSNIELGKLIDGYTTTYFNIESSSNDTHLIPNTLDKLNIKYDTMDSKITLGVEEWLIHIINSNIKNPLYLDDARKQIKLVEINSKTGSFGAMIIQCYDEQCPKYHQSIEKTYEILRNEKIYYSKYKNKIFTLEELKCELDFEFDNFDIDLEFNSEKFFEKLDLRILSSEFDNIFKLKETRDIFLSANKILKSKNDGMALFFSFAEKFGLISNNKIYS